MSQVLRRAVFYVPASSQKMMARSVTLRSDNVTYDLEDSVSPAQKKEARDALCRHLSSLGSRPSPLPGVREIAVRVNPVYDKSPFGQADLAALAGSPVVDAIVLPKINGYSALREAAQIVQHHRTRSWTGAALRPIRLIALIESAKAVVNLVSICRGANKLGAPSLSGLVFGAEDFARDLSMTRTPSLSEFQYARSAIVTAARAFHIPSVVDLVCTSYRGEEGARVLDEECRGGRAMGFNGKQVIHPDQLATVHDVFGVSEREAEWAVRVLSADAKAAEDGRGAWTLDGKMIDAPVVGAAKGLVERAEQCGIDVGALRERWKSQMPE